MFETTLFIWSNIGHTPLTKRVGAYCDELAKVVIMCADPGEALSRGRELLARTEHGYSGAFSMPDYPNQNTRSAFFHR